MATLPLTDNSRNAGASRILRQRCRKDDVLLTARPASDRISLTTPPPTERLAASQDVFHRTCWSWRIPGATVLARTFQESFARLMDGSRIFDSGLITLEAHSSPWPLRDVSLSPRKQRVSGQDLPLGKVIRGIELRVCWLALRTLRATLQCISRCYMRERSRQRAASSTQPPRCSKDTQLERPHEIF
jgi:hypothetical protein